MKMSNEKMFRSKNRVLFIVTKGEIGGAQKFVKEQIEILTEAGYECFLATNKYGWLTGATKNIVEKNLVDAGIEGFSLRYLFCLLQFLIRNHIGLVICNSANGGLYGRIGAWIAGKKSIYVSHGWSSVYNGGRFSFLFNKAELFLSYFGSSVLCISENDYTIAQGKIGISASKLKLIPNCIRPLAVQNVTCPKRVESPIVKILAVARFEYPKRIDLLVDSIKNIPNVHLSVIGGGMQFDKIKRKILLNNVFNVTLEGSIEGFNEFSNYDVFALISESEGLPISALEAMCCGNALVLSNVGGCKEVISNNGILVENTVESIFNGIQHCIINLDSYKSNSVKLFEEKFNLDRNKQIYLDYYSIYL